MGPSSHRRPRHAPGSHPIPNTLQGSTVAALKALFLSRELTPAVLFSKKLKFQLIRPKLLALEQLQVRPMSMPQSPQSYSGAYALLSVNGPVLEDPQQDFSLSQFWIIDRQWNYDTLSTIEVSWQTYLLMHPNDELLAPRLFISWTNKHTIIQDVITWRALGLCNMIPTGGAMQYYSTLAENGQWELEVEIQVLRDPTQLLWWLYVNNEPVGYWPAPIFDGRLQGSGNLVQWEGDIIFFIGANDGAHTKTTMGSGAFPVDSYPVAEGCAFVCTLIPQQIDNFFVSATNLFHQMLENKVTTIGIRYEFKSTK